MNRTGKAILWTLVFLLLLVAADQLLLRVEFTSAPLRVTRSFYLDFRQRLFTLGRPSAPKSVEAVIDAERGAPAPAASQREPGGSPRYLYVDDGGTLQFADSLEEIPPHLRKAAQRLDE